MGGGGQTAAQVLVCCRRCDNIDGGVEDARPAQPETQQVRFTHRRRTERRSASCRRPQYETASSGECRGAR